MSSGLRRISAVLAIAALTVGGAKVASEHTTPGSGFSTVQTAAADPTGPTGGPGDGGMNGSQFQPPSVPNSMPDYQGGINQPPLDQNNGISIYNTGAQGAPQQSGGQQAGQQPQQGQQPAHGTQIPDYQTATPYTQGPGKTNPDYQAPQQQSPQQGQQPQQNNQQPSQAPTQTQQPSQNDQQNQQDRELKQQCEQQAQYYGLAEQMRSFIASAMGGFGSLFGQPSRKWGPAFECNCTPQQAGPQKQSPETPAQTATEPPKEERKCTGPGFTVNGKIDGTLPIDSTRYWNAMRIITQGRISQVPERGQIIALITALRESHLENLGNINPNPTTVPLGERYNGHLGPGLNPADRDLSVRMADQDPNSLWWEPNVDRGYGSPGANVAEDNNSVGLFQQLVTEYGRPNVTMDPFTSAKMFYEGTTSVSNGNYKKGVLDWLQSNPDMSNPQIAQHVQISDVPQGYDAWEDAANTIFDNLKGCPNVPRGE
nr:hypothetical protein [Mycobacteroides saopaulense]